MRQDWTETQNKLGIECGELPGIYQQTIPQAAIHLYETALTANTRGTSPVERARTQIKLGVAYSRLLGGDRQTNLKRALSCFKAALEVYTPDASPFGWATTQYNLGLVYPELLMADYAANLTRAIATSKPYVFRYGDSTPRKCHNPEQPGQTLLDPKTVQASR